MSDNNVMFGHSSRLGYDDCYHLDRIQESVGPGDYRLNPIQRHNCHGCLSTLGPRGGSYGVSTTVGNTMAPSQGLVDIESMLSNRSILQSKCKEANVNNIDISKYKLQHARSCSNFLNPVSSRLTNPPQTYREMSINRFYDLPRNPQAHIFWNFETNTTLEAKDNYKEKLPTPQNQSKSLPQKPDDKCSR
jgi:hypothetical protein